MAPFLRLLFVLAPLASAETSVTNSADTELLRMTHASYLETSKPVMRRVETNERPPAGMLQVQAQGQVAVLAQKQAAQAHNTAQAQDVVQARAQAEAEAQHVDPIEVKVLVSEEELDDCEDEEDFTRFLTGKSMNRLCELTNCTSDALTAFHKNYPHLDPQSANVTMTSNGVDADWRCDVVKIFQSDFPHVYPSPAKVTMTTNDVGVEQIENPYDKLKELEASSFPVVFTMIYLRANCNCTKETDEMNANPTQAEAEAQHPAGMVQVGSREARVFSLWPAAKDSPKRMVRVHKAKSKGKT